MTVQNPCLSGGAIEIFLEPVLPAPRVLVVGDTPIAGAVAADRRRARASTLVAADGDGPRSAAPATSRSSSRRTAATSCTRCAAASRRACPYVGLVASPKRGAGVLDELRGDGVAEELLDRIDVPAGIDIGARTAAEIALSILAQIVAVRRGHAVGAEARPPRPTSAARPGLGDARGRPDLRDDRRRGGEHALGPARRRDGLLLLRGLQDQVRG